MNSNSIGRNLRATWVVDNDPYDINQLGHPYQGSMYHGFARASGPRFLGRRSATRSPAALLGDRGETTPPSKNDQVASGIGGAFLGEALFRMSNLLLERQRHGADVARARGRGDLAAGRLQSPRVRQPFRRYFSRATMPAYYSRLSVGVSRHDAEQAGHVDARSSATKASSISRSTTACRASRDTHTSGPSTTSRSRRPPRPAPASRTCRPAGCSSAPTMARATIAASGASTAATTTSRRRSSASRARRCRSARRPSGDGPPSRCRGRCSPA